MAALGIPGGVRFQHLWALPLKTETQGDLEGLDIDDECGRLVLELQTQCEKSGHVIDFRSVVAHHANIIKCMNTDILHFSAHGVDDGKEASICIEHHVKDTDVRLLGCVRPMTSSEFLDTFKSEPKRPKFVFVSACHSEKVGEAFVALGVNHVVAINSTDRILDTATQSFAEMLYSELLSGATVKDAFERAKASVKISFDRDSAIATAKMGRPRAAAAAAETTEHSKFLLLPRDSNHEVQLFTPPSSAGNGNFTNNSNQPSGNLERATSFFLGSNDVVVELYRALHHTQCHVITLTGRPGSGKSEIARRALSYSSARCEFTAFMLVDLKKLAKSGSDNAESAAVTAVHYKILKVQELTVTVEPDAQLPAPDASSSSSNDDDFRETLVDIFCKREASRQAVLLLDQCDEWLLHPLLSGAEVGAASRQCASRLEGLMRLVVSLSRQCPNLRIVVVSSALPQPALLPQDLHLNDKKVCTKPLKPENIAHLFTKIFRCEEGFNFDELLPEPPLLKVPRASFEDRLAKYGQNKIFVALEGHPGAAVTLANEVNAAIPPKGDFVTKRHIYVDKAKSLAQAVGEKDASLKKTLEQIAGFLLQSAQPAALHCSGGGGGASSGGVPSTPRSHNSDLSQFDWWHGPLTREGSKKLLGRDKAVGRFLVRESSKGVGFYAVDVVIQGGRFLPLLVVTEETLAGSRLKLKSSKEITGLGSDTQAYVSLRDLVERNGTHLRSPVKRPR
jgi:hypothetical protein